MKAQNALKLEGFKTRDVHTLSGKKGIYLEMYPAAKARPGQSAKEASKAAAVRFLLDEEIARLLIATIAKTLDEAKPPPELRQKH